MIAAARVLLTAVLPIALRHVWRRRLVAVVTTVTLACGVGAMTATQLLYDSQVAAYEDTALQFAGRAALQVSNGESGVAEEIADEVRSVPGVRTVAASVEGYVAMPDVPGERLYLYGVDLLADHQVRDYGAGAEAVVSDPLVFLAAPDSVALTRAFANAYHLRLQDRVHILTPTGVVALTLRALLGAQRGPASALDGRLAVVDLSVAQGLLRLDGRVSQLAVELDPAADIAVVERAIAARLGARGVVERPRTRTAAFARLVGNYRHGLVVAASIAMIVALYFVFNAATITVAERRRELGLLRSVGAGAAVATAVVVVEMVVLAVLGSSSGIVLGLGLARALATRFAADVSVLYGDVPRALPMLDGSTVGWSLGLGLVTPLLAALGPLRELVTMRPRDAWRRAADLRAPGVSTGFARVLGPAVLGGSGAVWLARDVLPISVDTAGMTALLGAVIGVALTVPIGIRVLTAAADGAALRVGRPLALLACRHLRCDARRSAVTCAAVLVSLAGTIAVTTWIASLERTLYAAFETVFADVDLLVSAGGDPFAPEAVRIPDGVVDAVAAWPEVARAGAVRIDRIAYEGSLAAVIARDTSAYRDGGRALHMVDGDATAAAAAVAAGTAAVVNQSFARRFGRRRGDMLELRTPEGLLRLPIAGIYLELAPGDLGTIHLDRVLYRRWWRDDTVNVVELSLRRAADRVRVAGALRQAWGDRHRIVVFTVEQMRDAYASMLGRLTRLVAPVLETAIVSALVGFVSAAAMVTVARARVFGVLRAIGMTGRQLAGWHALEAFGLAGAAVVIAVFVGTCLGRLQVEVLLRGMLGMSVLYAYPWKVATVGACAILAVTSGAGWWLGRHAGVGSVAAAVRSE